MIIALAFVKVGMRFDNVKSINYTIQQKLLVTVSLQLLVPRFATQRGFEWGCILVTWHEHLRAVLTALLSCSPMRACRACHWGRGLSHAMAR